MVIEKSSSEKTHVVQAGRSSIVNQNVEYMSYFVQDIRVIPIYEFGSTSRSSAEGPRADLCGP